MKNRNIPHPLPDEAERTIELFGERFDRATRCPDAPRAADGQSANAHPDGSRQRRHAAPETKKEKP